MNKNAEKWVAALESGEYQQTTAYLRDKDGFCCLGVACDLAVKHGVEIEVAETRPGVMTYDGKNGWLPGAVQNWLGLASDIGEFDTEDRSSDLRRWTLTDMNDDGHSFAEIAQTIRTHPELFVDGER